MTFVLGIDPGLSGAVTVMTGSGELVEVFDLPVMQTGGKQSFVKNTINASALFTKLQTVRSGGSGVVAYLESVASMPGQGVSSMFSMGHTLGSIASVLACLQIPYVMVHPQEWKKHYGLKNPVVMVKNKKTGELKAKKKKDPGQSRALAIQRFPEASQWLERVKDHNRAESLLIAHYGAQRIQDAPSANA